VAQEIWYRGEAVGVAQTPGKTNPHDFADGMYLTDQVEVATQYAELRSSDPNARRVWSVPIDTQGLKVLDLTTDPRWQKFLRPDPRLPDGEVLIKQANENYGRMFQSFVKKENIDLSQYDMVIGKEYVRGGRQLCVLQKNNKMSPLAERIRRVFRPVVTRSSTQPTQIRTRTGGIGAGLKIIGGAALMIGAQILVDYIWAKLLGKMLEDEMKKLEPVIDKALKERTEEIAEFLANGKDAFAIVHVTITEGSMRNVLEGGGFPLPPKVEFIGLTTGDTAVNQEGPATNEYFFGGNLTKHDVTYSFPVSLPSDAVSLYQAYRAEMQWYDAQLAIPSLADQDLARLTHDRALLAKQFADALKN
jgi:hypothetical protein